ncbi:MAG: thioredoxin [Wolbachia sp.]|nr:thioredoxin [Wolbachia sp.]MDD9336567.1 thioredoxin [Wolbachia sp.]
MSSGNITLVTDQNFEFEVIGHKGFVLVDFWAEWCGPCKQLMPYIEKFAQDKKDKIKVCKFDIDEKEATAIPSKYGIRSVPTLIIFQDGKEITRKVGSISDLPGWVGSEIN